MRPLSAFDILQIWEIGQNQHPLDRALTLLSFALPEMTGEELACLSIGQRDGLLLTLREFTLGATLESFAECPRCQEPLEFTLNTADLRMADSPPSVDPFYTLTTDEFELQFTLPNSRDLATIVDCKDILVAHQRLIQNCVQQASQNGVSIGVDQLPAAVLTLMEDQIGKYDSQAEMVLDLTCPACQYAWQMLFDIVTFFWTELSAQVKRLLREVHILARFYGWGEADILSMSSVRRQFYLELVL